MNYFELYPGDYLRDTTRLTLIQHGVYLKLLMTYYAEELPLPAKYDELFDIVSATKPAEKEAVKAVADKYFPVGPDGLRHNGRADEEIVKAQSRMEGSDERKANANERKRRSRERRSAMFDALREVGVVPDFDLPMKELQGLYDQHVTGMSRVTDGVTGHESHGNVTRDGTATTRQTPDPSKATAGTTHTTGQATGVGGTPAGHASAAMNRAGCRVTSQNPNLIAACAEGVTTEHLLELVRQFPDKPAGYVIAAARREHAERATPNGAPRGTDQPRESIADRAARRATEIFGRTGTE